MVEENKINDQIERIRIKLLDLGIRGNTLLHFQPRGHKSVSVVDEKSDSIFDILINQGKAMSFLPVPDAYKVEEEILAKGELPDDYEKLPPLQEYLSDSMGDERFEDLHLQTQLHADKLDIRLLKIDNEAQAYYQERGIDILYLAIGFIEWYEADASKVKRFAPLILLPVELYRKNSQAGFKIRYTGIELSNNETLIAKFKNDYRVELPRFEDYFEKEEGIQKYFAAVTESISALERWSVLENKIELGFFSFGKFQMYKDLDPKNWQGDLSLENHSVIRSLFKDGFVRDGEILDGVLSEGGNVEVKEPERLHLVKDSDSSQTFAISSVLKGANTVIQGPPGTGKSQTITNLIAEAVARDKKVLFVAQKLTALEVVKHRLDECHLGGAVLELHSHMSRPKQVLDSLRDVLYQPKPEIPHRTLERKRLSNVRQNLDEYVKSVSAPIGSLGVNYITALGKFMKHASHIQGIDIPDITFITHSNEGMEELSDLDIELKTLSTHLDAMGVPNVHPFREITLAEASPVLQEEIAQKISAGIELISGIDLLKQSLSKELHLDLIVKVSQLEGVIKAAQRAIDAPQLSGVKVNTHEWSDRSSIISTTLEQGKSASELRAVCKEQFIAQAFTTSSDQALLEIRGSLLGKVDKWWKFLSGDYRKAKKRLQSLCVNSLPKESTHYLEWVDRLLELKEKDKEWKLQENLLSTLFGVQWQGEKSDWSVLTGLAEWIFALHGEIGKGELPESLISLLDGGADFKYLSTDLAQLVEKTSRWAEWLGELQGLLDLPDTAQIIQADVLISDVQSILPVWRDSMSELYNMTRLNKIIEGFASRGLPQLAAFVKTWAHTGDALYHCIWYKYWASVVNEYYSGSEQLKHFDRVAHEGAIEEFKDLDSQSFNFAQETLVDKLYKELPNIHAPGEMEVLRREMNKKRRLLPVRKLLELSGGAILKSKPIFMMSPMSVATYLQNSNIQFDLVIFDEASQVTVPDAIGAICRGKQTVVVGDSKQMPPTTFMSRSVDVEDDDLENDVTAEIESILGLFLAQGTPEVMLEWHYRSKHESLIMTSNKEFYGGKLKVFPSSGASAEIEGLALEYLPDTVYDKGITRTNREEARHLSLAILKHAQEYPHLSLGAVAFSISQKEAILLEVEILRRKHEVLEEFLNSSPGGESFFVKNLENVQGDERDVIYISIGYGRTEEGILSQNYGPINNVGGERRLNVLISRAKQHMKIFSNFTADDMRTNETSPIGVKVLKSFLKYAQTGNHTVEHETGKEMDSPFEEAVYDAIKGLGYEVVPQVGSQGFFIDLAVVDPRKKGRYMLAVECDGASYHSSANARDRDRLRQAVLESKGWVFHRIWSTDWFRNSDREVIRLKERIEKELSKPLEVVRKAPTVEQVGPNISRSSIEHVKPEMESYKMADLSQYSYWSFTGDFSEVSDQDIGNALIKVVSIESPVSLKAVINRLLSTAGISRCGNKIQTRMNQIATKISSVHGYAYDGTFIENPRNEVVVRNRQSLPSSEKKLELVPFSEIQKALLVVIQESVSVRPEACFSEVASRLGFSRVTGAMVGILQGQLDSLIQQKAVSDVDERVCLV
ncbi:MAG: DUF3320 domain-containing protein [Fibrobacterales bacterium]